MAVVINEFEVVPEPQKASEPSAASAPGATQSSAEPPTPHDIRAAMRLMQERSARVRAH